MQLKRILMLSGLFVASCLNVSINNVWKVPDTKLEIAVEKQKPVRKTRIGPGAENQDRKPNFPDPENQDYRVSPETRTTIDTIGEGEPQMSTATNPPAANGHDPTPPPAPAFPSLLMRKAEGERL